MFDDIEAAFLRARLDEEEAAAKAAPHELDENWFAEPGEDGPSGAVEHYARHDPGRALREVATWRRILLEYSIPPGTDAVYGGTERETGFRLALSFALKAKALEWEDHPDYRPA